MNLEYFSTEWCDTFSLKYSLPVAQLQHAVHRRHIAYDDAHQNAIDCDAKFPLCPDSIWKAGFLIESDATFVNQNNAEQFLIKNK